MTTPDAQGRIAAPAGAERIEREPLGGDVRVAIVAAEYHVDIVQPLVDGAVAELVDAGVEVIDIVPVPGAFEVGQGALACATAGYDAVIVHACVIRGDTPHFDYVCQEAARCCADAAMATGVPVMFGVLTVENHQQAVDRVGGPAGHKGRECAAAVLQQLMTLRTLASE